MTACPVCLKGKLVKKGRLSVISPLTKKKHGVDVLKCTKCDYKRIG